MLQWELDMIRICLVGPDIYPDGGEFAKSFAFYSTSSDRFVAFDEEQVFKDWQDFLDAWLAEGKSLEFDKFELQRYESHYKSLEKQLADTSELYEIDSPYDTGSTCLLGPVDADLEALEHEYKNDTPALSFVDWLRSEKGFTLPNSKKYTFDD